MLKTDLFRKPTDANRYLNFSSYHPKHTFRSIVYLQSLRYRRIINDDALLSQRLDELKSFFIKSSIQYNIKLINDIVEPIKKTPRSLMYINKNNEQKNLKYHGLPHLVRVMKRQNTNAKVLIRHYPFVKLGEVSKLTLY